MTPITSTAEELMPKTTKRSAIRVDWYRALIPVSLVTLFILRFVLNAPLWIVFTLCLWVPAFYIGYPWLLKTKWTAFEREFMKLFRKGEYKALLETYKSQWFLRRFGPKAEMMGKLGLIYSALERYREAEQALERAVDATPAVHRDRLYFNLANVKFELGKYEAASQIYRSLKPGSPYRHAAQTQLALIDLHQGRRMDIAKKILEQEKKRATGQLKTRIEQALEQYA